MTDRERALAFYNAAYEKLMVALDLFEKVPVSRNAVKYVQEELASLEANVRLYHERCLRDNPNTVDIEETPPDTAN